MDGKNVRARKISMNDESTIGVAFLGLGRMGETHLRSLSAISGVKVVAVADPNPERAWAAG